MFMIQQKPKCSIYCRQLKGFLTRKNMGYAQNIASAHLHSRMARDLS
jgi:hypothetical protein